MILRHVTEDLGKISVLLPAHVYCSQVLQDAWKILVLSLNIKYGGRHFPELNARAAALGNLHGGGRKSTNTLNASPLPTLVVISIDFVEPYR